MFSYFINSLKSETGKDASIVFAGTLINVIVGGLFFVLAPRILGPSDYGLFSVVLATGLMVLNLANFGIDTGILRFIKPKQEESNQKYLKLAFKAYLGLGLLIFFLGYVLSPALSQLLNVPQTQNLMRIALSATIFSLLGNFFVAVLQTRKQFIKASMVNVSSNTARLVILVIASYFITVDLSFLTILTYAVTILYIIFGKMFVPLDFLKAKEEHLYFRNFVGFNFWIAASMAISMIPFDNYLLVKFAGATATGIYAAPFKLIAVVDQLAGNFSRVLASRFSTFSSHSEAKVYALKTIPVMALFFAAIAFGLIIAKPVVNMLLGEKYLESVRIFRILSLGFAFYFTNTTAVSLILYYLGKSKETFLITFMVKLFLFSVSIFLILRFQELGAAMAFLVSGILSTLLFNIYAAWQLTKSSNGKD